MPRRTIMVLCAALDGNVEEHGDESLLAMTRHGAIASQKRDPNLTTRMPPTPWLAPAQHGQGLRDVSLAPYKSETRALSHLVSLEEVVCCSWTRE